MKKRSFIRVFALLLCAMMLLTACSSGSSGGGGGSSKSSTSNTYETPLKLMMEIQNAKKVTDISTMYIPLLNGFAEKEVKAVFEARSKSEYFTDRMDDYTDMLQDNIDNYKDEYGSDYKYSYKIVEKEELERTDRNEFRDQIKSYAQNLKDLVDQTKDFDNSDWEDLAEELDLSKSEAKSLVAALEDLYKVLNDVEVTEGYEITYTQTLKGSELDEPDVMEDLTINVYKVNGRWISSDAISAIYYIFLGI